MITGDSITGDSITEASITGSPDLAETRRGPGPRIVKLLVTALAIVAIAALSGVSYSTPHAEQAVIRLSLEVDSGDQGSCRPPTDAELEGVAPHMRPTEVCETTDATQTFTLWVDGDSIAARTIGGSGANFIYEDIPVPAGRRNIRASLKEVGASDAPELDTPESDQADSNQVEETVDLQIGRVVLLSQRNHRLVLTQQRIN